MPWICLDTYDTLLWFSSSVAISLWRLISGNNKPEFDKYIFFFFPAKKPVEESEEKKAVQTKKKIKELRVLDGKSAQNLCKSCEMH